MKRAVVDIGTNTAHIIIAEVVDDQIEQVLYKKRHYTFLGEGGLKQIGPNALSRLWSALDDFSDTLSRYDCSNTIVLATESLRAASNRDDIEEHINNNYGLHIRTVSGQDEAKFVFLGARQAINFTDDPYVIMDIGGGSCEFIWVASQVIVRQESYPIGISRLFEEFHNEDPISIRSIQLMHEILNSTLVEMWESMLTEYPNATLIGCAGTFEIFLSEDQKQDQGQRFVSIPKSKLTMLLDEVRGKDVSARKRVKDFPKERAQYIVVALELMEYVCQKLQSRSFIVSKYALKEGALVSDYLF